MDKIVKDSLGWGFALWLIGYTLGVAFFFVFPPSLIGWIIMPIGTAISLFTAFRKVNGDSLRYYAIVGAAWTLMAVALDYIFIVMMLNPADGYYKLDVYVYYVFTLIIPLAAWFWKSRGK